MEKRHNEIYHKQSWRPEQNRTEEKRGDQDKIYLSLEKEKEKVEDVKDDEKEKKKV